MSTSSPHSTKKNENENENENITRKASWHRTYPIPRVQHYSAAGSACGFGTAGCTIQGPRPDPHTQVGSWHRHLMTGAAKRVPSLRLRRAAAMAACGVSSTYAKICLACPRIIATPSSRRTYVTCCATAVVLGMRPEQARVAMRVASDFTIVNADSPSSDFVPIHEKDTANNGICVLCFFLSETFVTSKAQS